LKKEKDSCTETSVTANIRFVTSQIVVPKRPNYQYTLRNIPEKGGIKFSNIF
jgi:hypothetical protein